MAYSGVNNTPFHRHQQDDTLEAYVRFPLSLLQLLLSNGTKYKVPLTVRVSEALGGLSRSLDDSDSDDQVILTIHTVFLSVWTTVWMPTEDNPIPCPTERCLAPRSVHKDGSISHPKLVTPEIARFERTMRLTFLRQIHSLAKSDYGGDMDLARQSMQRWFIEKLYSPFNTLRSLQHRGSAIVFATPSPPRSWWTDRVNWSSLLYRGHPVTLDGIRQVFAKLELLTISQWEDKVLMGLNVRVEYSSIADDLTNTNVGYSFLSDPRNKVFHNRDRLAAAILADPKLRAHFTVPTENGSGIRWSRPAMREWLAAYGKFEGLQSTRTETLAGAPGRSTELHSMNYCNTPTRTTRNLNALDKYISVMRLYTKTGASTGVDKQIPHALDALTADLLIQDLAIARPFAELAVQTCHPNCDDIMELYRYRLFVNNTKEFTSHNLTGIMESLTLPIIGFGVGINSWRHIHRNFSRKLSNRGEEMLQDSELNTAGVLQYGHSKRIDDSIYGLSHDASMGLPEDILPYYLDASTDWQVVARVVPGMCFIVKKCGTLVLT
jgi:hypothetical protein